VAGCCGRKAVVTSYIRQTHLLCVSLVDSVPRPTLVLFARGGLRHIGKKIRSRRTKIVRAHESRISSGTGTSARVGTLPFASVSGSPVRSVSHVSAPSSSFTSGRSETAVPMPQAKELQLSPDAPSWVDGVQGPPPPCPSDKGFSGRSRTVKSTRDLSVQRIRPAGDSQPALAPGQAPVSDLEGNRSSPVSTGPPPPGGWAMSENSHPVAQVPYGSGLGVQGMDPPSARPRGGGIPAPQG